MKSVKVFVAMSIIMGPLALMAGSGWYGGANIGDANAKIDDARIANSMQGGAFTATSITDKDHDLGYKIFGGYQFNENLSVEGGYFDLGNFGFSAATVPAGTLNGEVQITGFNMDVVGTWPLTEKFSVIARIGWSSTESKSSFSGTGLVHVIQPESKENDINPKFGVGLQYHVTESFGLRLEVERYRINDSVGNTGDVDLTSMGMTYRFGEKTPPTFPERQPTAIPSPVISSVAVMKVTFSVDSLFDFGKATIRPAGQVALDKFAANLQGITYDVITVTGHTDRLSSHAYNMKLSRRRAEAVKAYLVESAGIPADKIAARRADEADPVTKPGQCVGKKATKKLIACLQPDRRVEVDVLGSRSL